MKTPQPESCSDAVTRILRDRLGLDIAAPPASIDQHEQTALLVALLAEAWAAGHAAATAEEVSHREQQQRRLLHDYLESEEF